MRVLMICRLARFFSCGLDVRSGVHAGVTCEVACNSIRRWSMLRSLCVTGRFGHVSWRTVGLVSSGSCRSPGGVTRRNRGRGPGAVDWLDAYDERPSYASLVRLGQVGTWFAVCAKVSLLQICW